MALSLNKFTFAGGTDYDLNFALGYSSKEDITAYVDKETPINVEFDWLTDNKVRITLPVGLKTGDTIVFVRTVPKTSLSSDLSQPGNLTRENVQNAILQVMYAQHEILDGRFSDLVEVSDALVNSINNATDNLIDNLLFKTNFRSERVFQLNLTGDYTATHTAGDISTIVSDLKVFVTNNPTSPIEVLLFNEGVLFYSFSVSTEGAVNTTYSIDIDLKPGVITSQVVGSNYSSGAEITVALPVVNTATVGFPTELSNYVELFEEALTT